MVNALHLDMQIAIPSKALKKEWSGEPRKAWGASLKTATEPSQVLQVCDSCRKTINFTVKSEGAHYISCNEQFSKPQSTRFGKEVYKSGPQMCSKQSSI